MCLLCTTCNEIKYTISPNFIFVFCQFVGGFIPFHMILPANIWGGALCSLLQHIPHFSMYIIHCLWSHMFALFFQTKKNYIWQDLRNFGLPSSDQICLKSNDSKKNSIFLNTKRNIILNAYQITFRQFTLCKTHETIMITLNFIRGVSMLVKNNRVFFIIWYNDYLVILRKDPTEV